MNVKSWLAWSLCLCLAGGGAACDKGDSGEESADETETDREGHSSEGENEGTDQKKEASDDDGESVDKEVGQEDEKKQKEEVEGVELTDLPLKSAGSEWEHWFTNGPERGEVTEGKAGARITDETGIIDLVVRQKKVDLSKIKENVEKVESLRDELEVEFTEKKEGYLEWKRALGDEDPERRFAMHHETKGEDVTCKVHSDASIEAESHLETAREICKGVVEAK